MIEQESARLVSSAKQQNARVVLVDVLVRIKLAVKIDCTILRGERADHSFAAKVDLSPAAGMIALVASNEAALITRSESRRDHTI